MSIEKSVEKSIRGAVLGMFRSIDYGVGFYTPLKEIDLGSVGWAELIIALEKAYRLPKESLLDSVSWEKATLEDFASAIYRIQQNNE